MVDVLSLDGEQGRTRILVHGGAGGAPRLTDQERQECRDALARGARAGQDILDGGGSAEDAVVAAVTVFEDFPLFNAGRGAALTTQGVAEMDACLMTGDGQAGAVTVSRRIRNPILGARAVLEHTPHVMIADPSDALLEQWGVASAPPEYFVTGRRESAARRAHEHLGEGHGTVGAVALDAGGHLACATSTGGLSAGKLPGRVSDTSIVGAGSFARDGVAAVSCTGFGEGFIRAAVGHDVIARMQYGGASLEGAVRAAIPGGDTPGPQEGGGIIAVGADGQAVLAFNTAHMWRAHTRDGTVVVPEQ